MHCSGGRNIIFSITKNTWKWKCLPEHPSKHIILRWTCTNANARRTCSDQSQVNFTFHMGHCLSKGSTWGFLYDFFKRDSCSLPFSYFNHKQTKEPRRLTACVVWQCKQEISNWLVQVILEQKHINTSKSLNFQGLHSRNSPSVLSAPTRMAK